jgi:hypothetical protein
MERHPTERVGSGAVVGVARSDGRSDERYDDAGPLVGRAGPGGKSVPHVIRVDRYVENDR